MLFVTPQFCISIVFSFSWELKWPQEKLKTMLMQNFGVINKTNWQQWSTPTNSAVWPVPYACAQPYHPGSGSHGQLFRPCWGSSAWHSRRVNEQGYPAYHRSVFWSHLHTHAVGELLVAFPTNSYHLFTVELALKAVLALASAVKELWYAG